MGNWWFDWRCSTTRLRRTPATRWILPRASIQPTAWRATAAPPKKGKYDILAGTISGIGSTQDADNFSRRCFNALRERHITRMGYYQLFDALWPQLQVALSANGAFLLAVHLFAGALGWWLARRSLPGKVDMSDEEVSPGDFE